MIDRVVKCLVIVLLACFPGGEGFPNPYKKFVKGSSGPSMRGASGEPLLLTSLLKAGKYEEARNKSAVHHAQLAGVESYAGFITVNEQYNSNLFFWYFPAKSNPATAPVLMWLQGGPGASSLIGLFEEHGPFKVLGNETVVQREYSWHENHHMIYVDSPVGTGFSFTDKDEGYATNEEQVGANLYQFMQQFFALFDNLKSHPFYISGESYGGKYVPALGHAIQRHSNATDIKINLQGLAIGNGYTDPLNQLNYGDYLYQLGLIDVHAKEVFEQRTAEAIHYANSKDYAKANYIMSELLDGVDGRSSFLKNVSGIASYYNYLQIKENNTDDNAMVMFLSQTSVRKAIHVGDLPFMNADNGGKVAEKLANDELETVAPWVEDLLADYRVLFYNGQLDIICAYPMAVNFLRKLSFPAAEEYRRANRQIYWVDGEVAGYIKKAGNLQEMLIRAAGHMVPHDQPKWAFDVISAFTHRKL